MTKQPSYRFAGYTEPWSEKKLGEIIDINSGESPAKFHEGYTPYVKVDDLNYCDKYLTTTKTYVDTNNKVKKIEKGSIVFPKRGAAILTNKIRILNTKAYMDTNMMSLSTDKSNLEFLYTVISNVGLYKIADTSTIPQINNKHILPYIISLPSLPEQTAIGSFFQDIDQLISLQQRKLEVLKEHKKTYLKLLFPAKGQTKPALRFAGFEDEWKEVKLGEIAELKRGLTYKPTSVVENGIRVLRSSNIDGDVFKKQEDDVFVEDSSVTIPYVQFGDILITAANGSSKLVGKHAIIEDSEKMVHGGFMLLARSKQYKFLNALLSSEWYSRFINVSVSGGNGAIGNLSKSNLEKEIVLCPTIPEQEAIGSFFQDLDKAIAKQEEKVNQLKESKQTLLRKMFI